MHITTAPEYTFEVLVLGKINYSRIVGSSKIDQFAAQTEIMQPA